MASMSILKRATSKSFSTFPVWGFCSRPMAKIALEAKDSTRVENETGKDWVSVDSFKVTSDSDSDSDSESDICNGYLISNTRYLYYNGYRPTKRLMRLFKEGCA